MKNSQNGPVVLLIVAIIALLVIGTGIYIFSTKEIQDSPKASNKLSIPNSTPTFSTTLDTLAFNGNSSFFKSNLWGFQFQYPISWIIKGGEYFSPNFPDTLSYIIAEDIENKPQEMSLLISLDESNSISCSDYNRGYSESPYARKAYFNGESVAQIKNGQFRTEIYPTSCYEGVCLDENDNPPKTDYFESLTCNSDGHVCLEFTSPTFKRGNQIESENVKKFFIEFLSTLKIDAAKFDALRCEPKSLG